MASNIVLKTFAAGDDGQGTVTPQDDAFIYQNAVPMNGIFSGCAVTLSEANVLHVSAGFGIIGGRFFEVNESDISVELSSSGTLLGRLYIHLELTNADVPISIDVATGSTLPALVGDPDLNINDGAFDLELATFNVSEVTISDIVNTFPTISKANNQLRRATAYSLNDMVLCQSASDSLIFICTTAGTTSIQEPTGYATITDGNTITDGTAVFKAYSVSDSISKAAQVSDSNDAYDSTRPYNVGDLCIYNNVLYRCITACSAGSWATNQSCFTQDTLVNAVNGISKVSEWNPTLYYANQTTPLSYDRIVKSCIKIGKMVTLFANLHITANGNGTGLRLTNYFSNPHLPYTPATSAVGTMIINGKLFGLIIDANSTYAAVTKTTSEGDASVSDLPSIPSGGFTVCRISISYYTY